MIWLLIGYMFLFIHRPFEVWPVLGTFRIELLYMLFAGTAWLVYPRKRFSATGINLALLAFALTVLLSGLTSRWSYACEMTLDGFFKFLVFYLMLVTTVKDERDLKRLVLGFMAVMAMYVLHSYYEFLCGRYQVRMGIMRMVGVDLTSSNPNAFGASIVLSLVFVPVLWREYGTRVRWFLAGYTALGVMSISLTGSRGAFLALVVGAFVILLRSRHRWALAVASVLAVPALWGLMSDQLQNRFTTIIDPSVGPANAQASADARIIGLETGARLMFENPLFGVGPGAWIPASRLDLLSHNLYGQLMGELGFSGVLTFGSFVACIIGSIFWIRRSCPPAPDGKPDFMHGLAGAVGLALFLLLLLGNFGHNLFRYNWYWYGAFLVIARQAIGTRQQAALYWQASEDDEDYPREEWSCAEPELMEAR